MGTDVSARQSPLDMLDATLARRPDGPALHWFDDVITWRELDGMARAFAHGIGDRGVSPGNSVALVLQNDPQFVVALIGAWRAGCSVVPLNPMYKRDELRHQLADSKSRIVVTLDTLEEVVRSAVASLGSSIEVVAASTQGASAGAGFEALLSRGRAVGSTALPDIPPETPAFLTYTSGTTGPPKAAMNTAANVAFQSKVVVDWLHLSDDDVILAVAPLFHITGLITYLSASMLAGSSVLLTHRFDAASSIHWAEKVGATCTVAPITAYIAMLESGELSPGRLCTMGKLVSGGAPVAAAVVERFESVTGTYVHNAYGLTETTSVALAVPLGTRAPVDPQSGALSVGLPMARTEVAVIDPQSGARVDDGQTGEIVVRGPHVVPGYWRRLADCSIDDAGWMRTGDVGKRDAAGFFYVVDRIKDVINASGFKVWPRDVEDVLLQHESVREACVVGAADAYRGETVVAWVSLRSGGRCSAADLIQFCRERLATFKCPRRVIFLDDLPKTTSGKVLRRDLRERLQTEPTQ